MDFVENFHFIFRYLKASSRDDILLSYYDHRCYYDRHRDGCVLTSVINLHKEPKAFTGGDLVFPEYDYVIPPENNRLILFPGQIDHAVSSVIIPEEKGTFEGNGRYTITTFINMK